MKRRVKLSEIVDFQYWYTASATKEPIWPQFLRITDIVPDLIDWKTVPYCEISERDQGKYRLYEGDIVVARTGATAWWAKLLRRGTPESVFASYLIRLRPKKEKSVLPEFLWRVIESQEFKDFVDRCKWGAAQPQANVPVLKDFEVELPESLEEQRRIAGILSEYDDLIENDTKRIRVLESMAEELYKEWFVRFRFPGYESVKMVESGTEFGMIPEGWEVGEIWDFIETLWWGTPSTWNSDFWTNGTINWYSPVDLTTSGTIFSFRSWKQINELALKKSSAKMFPPYSVMLTSRATIGVISINTTPACTNQWFITCVPGNGLSAYQIYFWLKLNKETIISLSWWATFKEISRGTFRKIPILKAEKGIHDAYANRMSIFFGEIENLERSIETLRKTREVLISELI